MNKKLPQGIIAIPSSVSIEAAAVGEDGTPKGPPKFRSEFYTGGELRVDGWDRPVVVDLAGVTARKNLVANLDHDPTQRVGQFALDNDGKSLTANGTASARTPAREQVIGSSQDGWNWEASIEAEPAIVESVEDGETAEANGRTFTGPIYVARESIVTGFGFVSHGADANTTVSIAASADSNREKNVDAKLEALLAKMDINVEDVSPEQLATIEAQLTGEPKKKVEVDGFDAVKAEAKRKQAITKIAIDACEGRFPDEIESIEAMADRAIRTKQSEQEFKLELLQASAPGGFAIHSRNDDPGLSNQVLEAAICAAGGLSNMDSHYGDQVLQAAHDRFKGAIGLNQVMFLAAKANGGNGRYERHVTGDTLRAAFGGQSIRGAAAYSTMDISVILSNVANKFLRQAWDFVEDAWSQISTIRPVSDFKEITTVSLTADLTFKPLENGGIIQHGTAGEVPYANKADTYARMFAITRTDFINDDLGALTAVPRKLGRGGALKLNNIFWTEFLDNATFFSTANGNLLEGTPASDLSREGLDAAESLFDAQTDPEGEPLGSSAEILLVPSSLYNTALEIMGGQGLTGQGADAAPVPNRNIFAGRYQVVKSRYLENASYTGNSATAWYLLASPQDLPVIEVAALNGNVMPTVDSADADFNTLGIQMRGYSDVGVRKQEYRGGNKSTGAA